MVFNCSSLVVSINNYNPYHICSNLPEKISKTKLQLYQLAKPYKIEDYWGRHFSSALLMSFHTVGQVEECCFQAALNMTLNAMLDTQVKRNNKFETLRWLFRTRPEFAGGASLWGSWRHSSLLFYAESTSGMPGGVLNINLSEWREFCNKFWIFETILIIWSFIITQITFIVRPPI